MYVFLIVFVVFFKVNDSVCGKCVFYMVIMVFKDVDFVGFG